MTQKVNPLLTWDKGRQHAVNGMLASLVSSKDLFGDIEFWKVFDGCFIRYKNW